MLVFIINKHGEVLMPCSPRKARVLLKREAAKVVARSPFTIQLVHGTAGYKQALTLGVDTGHKEVGLSVVSETKEVFSAIAFLRNDISKKMTTRAMYRRTRRGRLRYRKPRFLNRSASTRKGRLAPSVQWKVDAHARLIRQLIALMPITKVVLETAKFDTQKLKNSDIKNAQYQKGIQYGFENVKAYVLDRDGYKCQCNTEACTSRLEVHHIKYRSHGGSDAPNNLITLCSKHHKAVHAGKLKLDTIKPKCLKSATTMSVIRARLLQMFPDAIETFGYVTKANRYAFGIEKTHSNDAFVIAGGATQKREKTQDIRFKQINNRSIQKNRNGFAPAIRKQRYAIRPKDLVRFEGKQYSVVGMQNKGKSVRITDGETTFSRSTKKIDVIYHQKGIMYL